MVIAAAPSESPLRDGAVSPWRLCVAPMMNRTDRHCRYFLRRLSARARLYTEMITTGALLHGDAQRFLAFDASEHPVALQLGGSDPDALRRCAVLGESAGYDEINLNVGCPSDRVSRGRFGACLMAEPALVADCVAAMRAAVRIPITVKTRIGIDDRDSYEEFADFVATVAAAGCEVFLVHARKAWLTGLSPYENRNVPPLRYDYVRSLKRMAPALTIVVNGGIVSAADAAEHLECCDGVMIGRAVYETPYVLAELDRHLFAPPGAWPDRHAVVESLFGYVAAERQRGTPFHAIARHLLGLYRTQPGGRRWRRALSDPDNAERDGEAVLEAALAAVADAESTACSDCRRTAAT